MLCSNRCSSLFHKINSWLVKRPFLPFWWDILKLSYYCIFRTFFSIVSVGSCFGKCLVTLRFFRLCLIQVQHICLIFKHFPVSSRMKFAKARDNPSKLYALRLSTLEHLPPDHPSCNGLLQTFKYLGILKQWKKRVDVKNWKPTEVVCV